MNLMVRLVILTAGVALVGCRSASAPPTSARPAPAPGPSAEIDRALRGESGTAPSGPEAGAEPPARASEPASRVSAAAAPAVRPTVAPTSEAGEPKVAATEPAPVAAVAAPARAEDRAADVNGKVITRSELVERLLRSDGAKLLDAMVELELARQMAVERGIVVSEADLAVFVMDWLKQLLKSKGGIEGVSREQLEELARSAAANRGESWTSTEMTLRRTYYLDRIARAKLTVSEDELRREFTRQHGEKLTLRCLALANQADAAAVRRQLEAGADFAETARKVSLDAVTAARGGMCEPVGRNALPKAVEDEVFSLKDGQLSRPVYYPLDGRFYLFQLVSRTPAAAARFEQVRGELRAIVEHNKVQAGIAEQLRELKRRKAKVVYFDEALKSK
jgi:parvulin-like peptidyl-prolyl isomerase